MLKIIILQHFGPEKNIEHTTKQHPYIDCILLDPPYDSDKQSSTSTVTLCERRHHPEDIHTIYQAVSKFRALSEMDK